jgi:hypothetical protein
MPCWQPISGPRPKGGELLLVISGTAVLRIFAITSMDRMIPNFTTLDQALAYPSPANQTAW